MIIKYIVILTILFIVIYYYVSKYKIKETECKEEVEDSDDMSLSYNTKKLINKSFKEHFS